jgi:hypothetical protein
MAYTEYFDYTSGLNLYAKAKPLDTGTWSDGVIALTENGTTGEYSASTFVDNTSYNVYEETTSPGTPASTDDKVGNISPPQGSSGDLSAIEAELLLIRERTDQINAYDVYPPTRQQNNDVAVYLGETTSLSFTTATDYSAKTLRVMWQEADKTTVVAVVNDGDISKTTSTITVDSLPTAVTLEEQILYYSIRDVLDGDRVLAHGKCFVKYAATSS